MPQTQIHIRNLSFYDGVGIIVGIIIGSGVFSSPGLALLRAGSPGMTLISWVFASFLVALTCQCYFELGCMMPSAGGDYEYLQQAYGNQAAFSFAWFNFFISKPGSQAIIATIFGQYFETVFTGSGIDFSSSSQEESSFIAKIAAVILIIVITLINCWGIKESAIFQNILTLIKLFLVLFIFITAIVFTCQYPATIQTNLALSNSFQNSNGIVSIGSAMIACLWSYDGWADIIFLLEDLREPNKQLPRIVLSSLGIVTIAYILTNISYFAVLTVDQIILSPAIAYQLGVIVSDKLSLTSPAILPTFFAIGVALSAAGSCHGSIMTGGKALYAVARDGHAPASLAAMSPRGAPYMALLAQGGWGVILLLLPSSSFSSLLGYFGPASWFFYALSSSSVIYFRIKQPSRHRPYKLPFYPLPVLLVIIIAFVIILSSFLTEVVYTSLAFGFIALSLPVHFILERFHMIPSSSSSLNGSNNHHQHRTTVGRIVSSSLLLSEEVFESEFRLDHENSNNNSYNDHNNNSYDDKSNNNNNNNSNNHNRNHNNSNDNSNNNDNTHTTDLYSSITSLSGHDNKSRINLFFGQGTATTATTVTAKSPLHDKHLIVLKTSQQSSDSAVAVVDDDDDDDDDENNISSNVSSNNDNKSNNNSSSHTTINFLQKQRREYTEVPGTDI